ncbi:hypothetical protein BGZ75_003493 [Mortierella antarctica]|nr:hypothetical protein BGZ75_003493 [Mortierella antarctica]
MSPEATTAETTSTIQGMEPHQVADSIWLTPIWKSDSAEIFRVLNIDSSIAEGLYAASIVLPFPEDGATSFAERQQQKRLRNGVCTTWAIRTQADGPMIGLIALDPFDHGDLGLCYQHKRTVADTDTVADVDVEASTTDEVVLKCGGFGYWISPEHAGKGIMTQVVVFALTRLARQEFNYDRVHGEAWTDNTASCRVMERAGMRRVPGLPCFVPKFNATKDIAHYVFDVHPRPTAPERGLN